MEDSLTHSLTHPDHLVGCLGAATVGVLIIKKGRERQIDRRVLRDEILGREKIQ